jgi:benzoyl-CoA reductase/2-hydroxyglutaryl-CoA dehydratase subunit BcrC/BadD/HgdB
MSANTGGKMDPLDIMKKHYKDRSLAAREWKSKGKKVVGYIGEDVPEELILAAGFFPVRISGDPAGGTTEADKFAETFYDPSVRSVLDQLLSKKLDYVDYLVIAHSSDAVLKLYHQLWWIHNLNPSITFPPVHLFDILHTKFYTTGLYALNQVRMLKSKLEEWSGKTINNEDILKAIAAVNRNRALLKKIHNLRTSDTVRISGVEALQITGSSMFMFKEDHSRLLEEFIKSSDNLAARNGVRLYVEGSDTDNTEFYEIAESCGALITGENSSWGCSYAEDPVDESVEPVMALADRYQLRPSRYRIQTIGESTVKCLEGTKKANARSVVFYLMEGDPAPTWDVPNQKKELDKNNIPSFNLSNQKYFSREISKQDIKSTINKFIDSISKR